MKPSLFIVTIALTIVINIFLSAYDFPWKINTIEIPGFKTNLTLSVRRAHPMLAEYEYKVSGILPDGKEFTQMLVSQTGGQALMTLDYLPSANSTGYIRFEKKDPPHEVSKLQYLNLQTGVLEEPKDVDWSYMKELGFIDLTMQFRKPSYWLMASELAELAYYNHDFEKAYQYAFSMKQEAGIAKDKGLLVNALYLMARMARNSKPVDRDIVIRHYNEAIKNSAGYGEKRADGIEVVPEFRLQLDLASFYSQEKMYSEAKENIWAVIESLKGAGGWQWKISDSERTLFTEEADIESARLELKQGFKLKAAQILSGLSSKRLKNDDDMRTSWGELYPYIVIMEHDMLQCMRLNPAGAPLSLSGAFEILPDGKTDNLKLISFTGAKTECDFLFATAVYGGCPASKHSPFPFLTPVRCLVRIDCKPDDFRVAVTRPPVDSARPLRIRQSLP